jgi:hypothetical protein
MPNYVDKAYGSDYPLSVMVTEVMLGYCALWREGE